MKRLWQVPRIIVYLCIACLPIPEKKSTSSVLDSEYSILFDQAENRLHMQKAILSKLSQSNHKI